MLKNEVGWDALGMMKGDKGDLVLKNIYRLHSVFLIALQQRIVGTEVESDRCLTNSSNDSLAVRHRGTCCQPL